MKNEIILSSLLMLVQCTSYNLDDKIQKATSGNSGTSTAAPTTPSGPTTPAVNRVYLFPTVTQTDGNFGGRTGADALCMTARLSTTFIENQCTKVRAFVSLSASDEIVDLASNYGMPTGLPFNGVNGALLANNQADLLDSSISVILSSAGITLASGWYSLSGVGTGDGTLDAAANCSGGTSAAANGRYGLDNSTGSSWMSLTQAICSTPRHLLCVCY